MICEIYHNRGRFTIIMSDLIPREVQRMESVGVLSSCEAIEEFLHSLLAKTVPANI
jgi:hypothetical protein